jgi:hypothetical protein
VSDTDGGWVVPPLRFTNQSLAAGVRLRRRRVHNMHCNSPSSMPETSVVRAHRTTPETNETCSEQELSE